MTQTASLDSKYGIRNESDRAYETLRDAILEGELKPGDELVLHDHRLGPEWPGRHGEDEGYLIGLLVGDVIEATDKRIAASQAHSARDLQKLDHNVIGYTDDMQRRNTELKKFLFKKLYNHPRVVRMAEKASRVLSDIFNAYLKAPAMLPYDFQALVKERGLQRTVCDYLAGMTDRYAIQEYGKLFDPHSLP